jgi:hypothetical protein|tara:strand:- start:3635 stop:3898 length:264 start_codon:yes stop_codon:yes gene_type:complete
MSDITIEKCKYGGWSVYEFGVYPRSSVLAGQTRKQWIAGYDTLEKAQLEHPTADVGYMDANNSFDHLPEDDMESYERECLRRELYDE